MAEPAQKPTPITVEEFWAWPGDGTGTRYELVEGQLRAMAPASGTYGTIHANLTAEIRNRLRATRPGCRVVSEPGIRPRIRENWDHRIPELAVTCTPNRADELALPDPLLIVEVLSPSNRDDTWNNILRYATLPSVEEILIVDSQVVKVEMLRRLADHSWAYETETTIGLGSSVQIDSIGLMLPLAAIYADTHLAVAPEA